mgnify:CR=1 FL=1
MPWISEGIASYFGSALGPMSKMPHNQMDNWRGSLKFVTKPLSFFTKLESKKTMRNNSLNAKTNLDNLLEGTVKDEYDLIKEELLQCADMLVNYTKYGKAMQAIAEDQITASLLGINTDKFIIITFFISSFLAGLAGTLVASSVSIAGPYFGIGFGLRGLAVIVLGVSYK